MLEIKIMTSKVVCWCVSLSAQHVNKLLFSTFCDVRPCLVVTRLTTGTNVSSLEHESASRDRFGSL